MEPASTIIARLHGLKKTAQALGLNQHTVKRWRVPREAGGSGGAIPQKHHYAILVQSMLLGDPLSIEEIALTPEQRVEVGRLSGNPPCKSPNKNKEIIR
ncbi:conserved hypothetical protein [Roseibium sp. TrichSKD4]|uniref:hypothetical protein n=1 Tax=Roseibium sp. TrichSKD4 TaxID=744980 RepID=UPI0001E563A1|nr:hypothetical protein [Roseibium sp. TrichSKD4]EFO33931.1 conserved hypothetical protein [Roseibium sp. TrichSKD4]